MALSQSGVVYLRQESNQGNVELRWQEWELRARTVTHHVYIIDGDNRAVDFPSTTSSPKKGYDFSKAGVGVSTGFTFTPPNKTLPQPSIDPFVFGSWSHDIKSGGKSCDRFASLQKWLKGDDGKVSKEKFSGSSSRYALQFGVRVEPPLVVPSYTK